MEGTLQPCCVIHARLSIPVSHALLSVSPSGSQHSRLIQKNQGVIFTACRHVKVRCVKSSWWFSQMSALASRRPCRTSARNKCSFHHSGLVCTSAETATLRVQRNFGRWQRAVCADISGVIIKQARRQARTGLHQQTVPVSQERKKQGGRLTLKLGARL